MDELISKLRTALADPYAPWYGSDLVPLVADLIDVATRLRAEIVEAQRFVRECVVWTTDGRGHTLGCMCDEYGCHRRRAALEGQK